MNLLAAPLLLLPLSALPAIIAPAPIAAATSAIAPAAIAPTASAPATIIARPTAAAATAAAAASAVTPAPADTFADAGARVLFHRARAARQHADRSIHSYEAVIRQRAGVSLRTPLKDRTIYREESAARALWFRDAPAVIELLAAREQNPDGVEVPTSFSALAGDDLFEPGADQMRLGIPGGAIGSNVLHPLGRDAESHYRYRSGDTLSITFPDGQRLRVAELQILPRERSPRLISGALWVEPESGAIVQAVFRLAQEYDVLRDSPTAAQSGLRRVPGFLQPIEFRLDVVVIEFSLWNMRHWLPRVVRAEGMVRAGAVRAPYAMESAWDIQDVWTAEVDSAGAALRSDSVFAAWRAAGDYRATERQVRDRGRYRELVPRDPQRLLSGELLPPPIWRDAPEFLSSTELRELERVLERIPAPARAGMPVDYDWSIAAPGLLRYNRVEGLSIGAAARASYAPYSVRALARMGTADRVPNVELAALRDTRRHALQLTGFHALRAVEDSDRALGFGASLAALTLGRDDGDYFRATGAALELAPAGIRRRNWRAGIEFARHAAVAGNTNWSVPRLWDEHRTFRETIDAAEGTAVTGTVAFSPWWGTDPFGAQAGAELMLQGATGDFEFTRARLTLRTAAPLPAGLRIGAEAAAGASRGGPPIQRQWFLGGPASLRGYPGAVAVGPDFARARLEIGRQATPIGLTLFSDAGWAGTRSAAHRRDVLHSAGIGASLLDGLLRIDLARALRPPTGFRLEFYLDALL